MNCSAKSRAIRTTVIPPHAFLAVCFLVVGLWASVATHAQGSAELDDASARAQYAFLTSDVRALEEVLGEVSQMSFQANLEALKSYQLAYGYWKAAQLSAQRGPSARAAASKAAKACVEHAKAAVRRDTGLAEAFAVQAVCEDKPFAFQQLDDGECDRNRAMRTALGLAPKNPRVKLVAALCARSAQGDAQLNRWRDVVAAFDEAAKPTSAVADWGHAEALTLLAQAQLSAGQTVAARDAIERALVIAPDYNAAQAVLKQIASSAEP